MRAMEKGYTCAEAARILGLDVQTVRHHCAAGHLPAERFGRSYMIAADELVRFKLADRRPYYYWRQKKGTEGG